MNRETKIGMLTGLGVIVLIGVLLSHYFEDHGAGMRQAAMQDVRQDRRDREQRPVGVAAATPVVPNAGEGLVMRQPGQVTPPVAFAAAESTAAGSSEPVLAAPVAAQPAGPMPELATVEAGGPVLSGDRPVAAASASSTIQPAVYVPPDPNQGSATSIATSRGTEPAKAVGAEYTIASRDTLTTISRKFYHSATKADFARIIAANPTVLKDEKTPLMAGKKLIIPILAEAAVSKGVPTPKPLSAVAAGRSAKPASPVIGLPGSSVASSLENAATKPAEIAHVETPKTYTVEKGDTLEKIAGKTLGSKSKDAQQKLAAYNKLKLDSVLQVGQVLKVPAKMTASSDARAETSRTRG